MEPSLPPLILPIKVERSSVVGQFRLSGHLAIQVLGAIPP